eukprot:SAG31_NODE_1742_length_7385_cov_40.678836_3_plen_202_part_00
MLHCAQRKPHWRLKSHACMNCLQAELHRGPQQYLARWLRKSCHNQNRRLQYKLFIIVQLKPRVAAAVAFETESLNIVLSPISISNSLKLYLHVQLLLQCYFSAHAYKPRLQAKKHNLKSVEIKSTLEALGRLMWDTVKPLFADVTAQGIVGEMNRHACVWQHSCTTDMVGQQTSSSQHGIDQRISRQFHLPMVKYSRLSFC